MMSRCYSLFDRKALWYAPPFQATTDGAATRTLADAVAEPNSMVGRHPGDFVLFFVGHWDDQKGAMIPASPLVHIIDAVSLVAALQSEIPFPAHVVTDMPAKVVVDTVVDLDRKVRGQ